MKTYYITTDGSFVMKGKTIFFVNKDGKTPIPVEGLQNIYFFGSGKITTGVLKELSNRGIVLHIFGKYGNYLGTYWPKKSLIAGEITVRQASHYLDFERRMFLARSFVVGAMKNYNHILSRKKLERIEVPEEVNVVKSIEQLMQLEGNFKKKVYKILDNVVVEKFKINKRSRQPPKNKANAIISFLNSLVYSVVSTEIYHTHLAPEISFLHEPFERRLSLSLDVSEIFKPLLSEKVFMDLVNLKMLDDLDFEKEGEGVFLSFFGKRKVIKRFEEELNRVVKMPKSNRKRSIRSLIRMELYKLEKHILGMETYKPLSAWW